MPDGWRSGGKSMREEDDETENELALEQNGKFWIFENGGLDANCQEIKKIKIQLVKPAQVRKT